MNKLLPQKVKQETWLLSRLIAVLFILVVFSKPAMCAFQSGFSFKSGADFAWDLMNLEGFENPVLRSIFAQSESKISQSEKFSEIEYLFSCDPGIFVNVIVSDDGVNYTTFESYFADTSCNLSEGFFDSGQILKEIADSGYFDLHQSDETILSYEIRLSGYSPYYLPKSTNKSRSVYQITALTGKSGSDPTGKITLLFDPDFGSFISSEQTDYSSFSLKSRFLEIFENANHFYPGCKLLSISSIDFNNSESDSFSMGRFIDGYFTFLSKEGNPFTIYLFQNDKPLFCGNEFSSGSPVPDRFFLDSDNIAKLANNNGGLDFLRENVGSSISYLFGNLKIPGRSEEVACWFLTYQSAEKKLNLSFWIDGSSGEIIYKGNNVAVDKLLLQPVGFHLGYNFPNPFNGETNFIVTTSMPDYLDLSIYDLSGREVSTKKRILLQPGANQLKVDLGLLSSGMYLCRFITAEKKPSGQSVQFRKIVIQK